MSLITDHPKDREHVTLHIQNNPKLFSCINVIAPQNFIGQIWV